MRWTGASNFNADIPGPTLGRPMLAITKIICDRIRPLMAFGHFMEG